jgi:protein TonB
MTGRGAFLVALSAVVHIAAAAGALLLATRWSGPAEPVVLDLVEWLSVPEQTEPERQVATLPRPRRQAGRGRDSAVAGAPELPVPNPPAPVSAGSGAAVRQAEPGAAPRAIDPGERLEADAGTALPSSHSPVPSAVAEPDRAGARGVDLKGPAASDVPADGGGSGAGDRVGSAGGRGLGDGTPGASGAGSGSGPVGIGAGGERGTGAPDYATYLRGFRQRLQESLQYPLAARRQGLTGTVELEVVLEPSGRVRSVRLLSSSSHRMLDEAALASIAGMKPLPLPPELPARPLQIRVPVLFDLR